MADPAQFGNTFFSEVQTLINTLENLRTLNDRISQDSTLVTNYFTSPQHRSDIVVSDFNNASAAVGQLLFTFDSGNPTQKSFLFKLL